MSFVCFAASTAAAFVTVPLLEFLAALFLLFAYSTKFNERFKGFLWPLMVRCNFKKIKRRKLLFFSFFLCFIWTIVFLSFLSKDFLRCVTASIIFFIISIIAVSKYVDGSSKAAGVKLKVWMSLWPTPTQFMYYFVSSFSTALISNVLLFTDIWVHCHHRVRSRFLLHF